MDAVLYVVDLERMCAFYRDGLGLEVVGEHDGGADLACAGSVLHLVRVPPAVAADIVIDDPAVRREENPVKLLVTVSDLAQVRARVPRLGGAVDGADREWAWEGHVNVDSVDPEGNVVQLRAQRHR